jgi:hypothetical protein
VKKLLSIGVALALLTMAVVPGAVAAYDYEPETYAKVPFAVLSEGLALVGQLLDMANSKFSLGLPAGGIAQFTDLIADFTYGPLGWTVDMVAWGVDLVAAVVGSAGALVEAMGMTLPFDLAEIETILHDLACGLLQEWDTITCP